ncbi:MAG: hypothetical protein WA484_01260 [Solirubrobacteraceae bacterium]
MLTTAPPTIRSDRGTRLMVICGDYNGHADVPFMMSSDDFRLSDPSFSGKWTVVGEGAYDHATRTLTVNGRAYHVFSDWSLGEQRPARGAR